MLVSQNANLVPSTEKLGAWSEYGSMPLSKICVPAFVQRLTLPAYHRTATLPCLGKSAANEASLGVSWGGLSMPVPRSNVPCAVPMVEPSAATLWQTLQLSSRISGVEELPLMRRIAPG